MREMHYMLCLESANFHDIIYTAALRSNAKGESSKTSQPGHSSDRSTKLIPNLSNKLHGILPLSRRLRASQVQRTRDTRLHLLPELTTQRDQRAQSRQSAVKNVAVSGVRAVGLEHESDVAHEDFRAGFTGPRAT